MSDLSCDTVPLNELQHENIIPKIGFSPVGYVLFYFMRIFVIGSTGIQGTFAFSLRRVEVRDIFFR